MGSKLSELPAASTVAATDVVLITADPSGTPVSKQAALAKLVSLVSGTGAYASRPASPAAGMRYAPTDGAFEQIYDGTNWRNLVGGAVLKAPPAAATLGTHTGFGTSTLTDGNGILTFAAQEATGPLIRLAGKSITTLASASVTAGAAGVAPSANFAGWGIHMRESGTGKVGTLTSYIGNGYWTIEWEYWTDEGTRGTDSGNVLFKLAMFNGAPLLLRMAISGSNVLFQASTSGGATWITLATVAKTTIWTTAPDEFGISVGVSNNTAPGPTFDYFHLAFTGD